MAATGNDNDTEQNIPMDPADLEEEGKISTSLLLVRGAMQENITSSNSMLCDLITTSRHFKCVFLKWLIPLDVVA